MAVGRISGPLLKANLIRQGVDLAFETDLLYLDVNNQRIGINNASPQYELDVTGTSKTTNLVVTNQTNLGDLEIVNNTISNPSGNIVLGSTDNIVYQSSARIDAIDINNNTISTNDSNANLELRPNGTGLVDIFSNVNVRGNVHATGNISMDGNITIGDAADDSTQIVDTLTLNAEIASDIIPDENGTYNLGSPTQQWSTVYTENMYTTNVTTDNLTVGGVDLTLRAGNIIYVAENGDDAHTGTHPQDPLASVKQALTNATSGDTIFVYPGSYTEEFPLAIPQGVAVKGFGIRSVSIQPTTATRYNDAFLLNGQTTVEDITVTGFYSGGNIFEVTAAASGTTTINVGTAPFAHTYVGGGTINIDGSNYTINGATYDHTTGVVVLTHVGGTATQGDDVFISDLTFSCNGGNRTFPDNGYAFRFATDFEVTSRSPYIKNISVITQGSTTTAEDPRGFNAGDAGKGAYIDGAYALTTSKEASMLFHSATFIVPGVDAIVCTNGVRVEWLNSFTYFANRSFHCFDSNDGKYGEGKTRVRLGGIIGTFTAGNTITFTSADSSTVATATIESVDGDIITIDGKFTDLVGFDTTPQSITDGTATATTILNNDLRDFGAEVRMIGSASVYGNYGLVGDGPGVIIYAIGHNLAYIGNGKEVTNDPETVIQANEVVEINDAKVRYNSVDHKGDFRVGNLFYVSQEDGTVAFTANELNIDLSTGATFSTGGGTTFVNGERIDTGNLRISGNTIESLAGDVIFNADSDQINLQNNVNITGDLDVTGNVTIGGNITVGDEATDSIEIVAGIGSNIVPSVTNTYDIGESSSTWRTLYVNEVDVDDISINTNYITTTVSNSDLELRANGTGRIFVPDNNFEISNNLTVDGLTTLAQTNINGYFEQTGDYTQDGNTVVYGKFAVLADLDVSGQAEFEEIIIEDNFITTKSSNADLELRANGTGRVLIPDNDLVIENDLTVNGNITVENINSTGTITAQDFQVGDILIDDNYITTTVSNADLELRANGTGSVVAEGFTFENNDISTTGDMVFSPGSELAIFNNTGAIKLPLGDTSQRPGTPTAGQMRYNSELSRFEGYNGSNWINLKGVEDVDGDTKVTAELTEGANDNVIRFDIAGTTVVDIDYDRLNAPKVVVDDITIDGNKISTNNTNADLIFSANGTGSVVLDNFKFKDNTITNSVSDSITLFQNTGTGYVKFDGSYGLVLPVGDSLNRPIPAYSEPGMIRFNTADSRVEVWDGIQWTSAAGTTGAINSIDANYLAVETVLYLG